MDGVIVQLKEIHLVQRLWWKICDDPSGKSVRMEYKILRRTLGIDPSRTKLKFIIYQRFLIDFISHRMIRRRLTVTPYIIIFMLSRSTYNIDNIDLHPFRDIDGYPSMVPSESVANRWIYFQRYLHFHQYDDLINNYLNVDITKAIVSAQKFGLRFVFYELKTYQDKIDREMPQEMDTFSPEYDTSMLIDVNPCEDFLLFDGA